MFLTKDRPRQRSHLARSGAGFPAATAAIAAEQARLVRWVEREKAAAVAERAAALLRIGAAVLDHTTGANATPPRSISTI